MNGEPPAEESDLDRFIREQGPDFPALMEIAGLRMQREQLEKVINGAVIAIESILTDDHHDMGVSASVILGRVSAALHARLADTLTVETPNANDPYANWTPDELRAEIHALVASIERLDANHAHLVEINAILRTRPDLAERAPLVVALAEERDLLRDRYRAAWALEVKQTAVVEAVRAMWDNIVGTADEAIKGFPVADYQAIEVALDSLHGKDETMAGDDLNDIIDSPAVQAGIRHVNDVTELLDELHKTEKERDRLARLLDDARLRGYLPEMADDTQRRGPNPDTTPLADVTDDVLLDNLEIAYERSDDEPWWLWVWELINRGYKAGDERDRLRATIRTVLDGLAGPESENAIATLTSEHVDALKDVMRPTGDER